MLNKMRITLFILFFSSVSAIAAPFDKEPVLNRTLILNQFCLQAEIWGDVEIVLSPAYADRIVIQGDVSDVNRVETVIKNGRLIVKAKQVKQANKTRVIVPAAMLSFIRVNGKGLVTSSGELNTPQLKVELNGEACVQLRSSGSVRVEAAPDYDLSKH